MPSQASSGFAGGFVRGLANVLSSKRAEATRVQERKQGLAQSALKFLVDSGRVRDFSDLEPLAIEAGWIDQPTGKKPKAGEPDKRAILAQVLNPIFQQGEATTGGAEVHPASTNPFSPRPIPEDAPGPGQNPFSPRPVPEDETAPTGATPAAQKSGLSLMGVPIMSPEEAATQDVSIKESAESALQASKLKRAKAMLPALRELDPKATIWDAMKAVGLDVTAMRSSVTGSAPRFGGYLSGAQLPAGTQDSFGRDVDPKQRYRVSILPGGDFEYTPSEDRVVNAGAQMNAAAIRMGFKSAAEVPQDRQAELEETAERMSGEMREAGAEGTARGEQKKLLTPDEATSLQTTYGITREEAANLSRVPLTAPQVQAATESFLLDKDVVRAKELFEQVWPKTEQPEARRISLMALQRSQDPKFIELNSILKRMPLRLAVMTQGSRPSDTDREVFDAAFPSTAASDWSLVTVPTTYETGLQLLTAAEGLAKTSRESIGIVPLEQRQRTPAKPAETGGTGSTATIPGVTMKDGKLHINGKPVE